MTTKKKPRTGATGLPRIPCMVMMEVGGNFSITAILRLGRELRKTIGADGTCLSPTRFADCGSGNIGCSLIGLPRVRLERGRTSSSRISDWAAKTGAVLVSHAPEICAEPRKQRPRRIE